jgi:cytochrome b6-f complex iron-sulfur subunit
MPQRSRRREFLSNLAVAATVIPGFAIATRHVFSYLVPASQDTRREVLLSTLGELPVGGSRTYKDVLGNDLILVRIGEQEIRAFSVVCTHLGCRVQWDQVDGSFLCPCHVGRFDTSGAVISGPPPAPLPSFGVRIDQDKVFVTVPTREA